MELTDLRISNQQLTKSLFTEPKELVAWMGAIQAQDFAMSKWAIGLRLQQAGIEKVEQAFNKGDILRTHLMRPTWHIISAENIYWMLELTAPLIKASMKSRLAELELTLKLLIKCYSIFEKELANNNYRTREELVEILVKEKIDTSGNRASHIFMSAELEGLICSGTARNGKYTYALLPERVPVKNSVSREEALARLAGLYFQSHGPATLQDFQWWSGLRAKEATTALNFVKSSLVSETFLGKSYWLQPKHSGFHKTEKELYLLPAYDEYIISYKDRSAIIPSDLQKKAISENGFFRPVIVLDGVAIGLWKRIIKNEKVIIELEYFKPQTLKIRNLAEAKAEIFGQFLNKKVELKVPE